MKESLKCSLTPELKLTDIHASVRHILSPASPRSLPCCERSNRGKHMVSSIIRCIVICCYEGLNPKVYFFFFGRGLINRTSRVGMSGDFVWCRHGLVHETHAKCRVDNERISWLETWCTECLGGVGKFVSWRRIIDIYPNTFILKLGHWHANKEIALQVEIGRIIHIAFKRLYYQKKFPKDIWYVHFARYRYYRLWGVVGGHECWLRWRNVRWEWIGHCGSWRSTLGGIGLRICFGVLICRTGHGFQLILLLFRRRLPSAS